ANPSLARQTSNACTIRQEVIHAHIRNVHQQAPSNESAAGPPEIHGAPVSVANVNSQQPFPRRSPPPRTRQDREIQPLHYHEKTQTNKQELAAEPQKQ